MSHTNSSLIESDQCTPPYISQGIVVSTSCNTQQLSERTLPSPPSTPSPSSSLNDTCQRQNTKITLNFDQESNDHMNEQEQGSLPLAAAGLTHGMETNQLQSLTEILNISTTNPSHLFWVPASQHPELAPTEFEKYVTALRASAKDKGKVKRRRSVLSVSFTPDDDDNDTSLNDDDNDDDGDDKNHNKDEERQSALEDLENKHRLSTALSSREDLDHASPNNKAPDQTTKYTTKARKEMLRRSMSLNLPDNKDPGRIPDFLVFDRNSTTLDQSPVLVPKTDHPLSRRGARTRFQRISSIAPSSMEPTDSSLSTQHQWPHYRHCDSTSSSSFDATKSTIPNTDSIDTTITTTPEQSDQRSSLSDNELPFDDPQLGLQTILSTITKELEQDQQQQYDIRDIVSKELENITTDSSQPSTIKSNNTTPSPIVIPHQSTPKPSSRERKSSWSWSFWSDDKKVRTDQSPVDTESNNNNKTDTKPPMITSSSTPTTTTTSTQRFGFSSFFSRKSSSSSSSAGTAEQKTATTIKPPKDFELNKINHQHRLPIHMERAVYRLSHIKLANPRRPLRDQVLISNFMFWYLSIISQQQQQQQQEASQRNNDDNPPSPRPTSPRTPQQIVVAASKKKKKRLTRKSEQQPLTTPSSLLPNHQSSKHTPPSYQLHHPSYSPPPPHQHTRSEKAGHKSYTAVSPKQQSTGFVIPDDYLHPTSNPAHKNKSGRQNPSYARHSSNSSSEEDDDNKSLSNQSPRHRIPSSPQPGSTHLAID